MKDIIEKVVIVVITMLAAWVFGWIRTFLAKRLKVSGPIMDEMKKQGKVIDDIVPAVNILIVGERPKLDLLIALGESAQGQTNGNVTKALAGANVYRNSFDDFLKDAAKVEVKSA